MKSLAIYFSRNGENYMENGLENIEIGITEILAKRIADLTNSDFFKVEVVIKSIHLTIMNVVM